MPFLANRIIAVHRFLAQHSFYPLMLSSLLACSILLGRIYLSRSGTYFFLVWNLFLAWIPYLCSMWAASIHERHPGKWWRLLFPGALWLLFLPNAPYIVTDLMHLRRFPILTLWYDVGLLATFAWTGCFLGIASLRIIHSLVEFNTGKITSWLFVLGTLGLTGLGIYLGRFLRWNSWDLFLNPRSVIRDTLEHLATPRAAGVTFMFAAFLFICYITVMPTLAGSKNRGKA